MEMRKIYRRIARENGVTVNLQQGSVITEENGGAA